MVKFCGTIATPVVNSPAVSGSRGQRAPSIERSAILAAMLTYLRYALATFCFAASVGCLALWIWSISQHNRILGASWYSDGRTIHASVNCGDTVVSLAPRNPLPFHSRLQFRSATLRDLGHVESRPGHFGMRRSGVYFPLWYPALIFALAGVAAQRLGRRFTLRSAIIATTVVAGLLGMAVGL